MKFREHRGRLTDAMTTVVELTDRAALDEYLRKWFADYCAAIDLPCGPLPAVQVKPYAFDDRIGWDTHIVVIEGIGPVGFTDGPAP